MSAIDVRPLVSRSMEDLAADRDRFLATGEVTGTVRPVVREAWRRSAAFGVSAVELRTQQPQQAVLDAARHDAGPLLTAAEPALTLVHETLSDQPHLIALADADGLILRLLTGPGLSSDALTAANLVEGACWHERDIGSNGVGTALATGEPVILIGPEHYQDRYAGWTCVGVPLRGGDGTLLGALDLSVPNDHVNVHTWGWTVSIAQGIEARLRGSPSPQPPGPTAAMPLGRTALDDPFHAIRGVLDLLARQLDLAPTHAAFVEDARRAVDRAESRLGVSLRELLEREERLRLIVDNSPDTIFMQDQELRYTWGASRAGPFAPDEFIGRTDGELLDDPDDARMLTDLKRRVMREGRRTTVDMLISVKGRRSRVQATFEPARHADGSVVGLFGYVRDLTSEWRTREALRDNHARLRAVLDILPAGVWITDSAGRILEANAAAADLWGGRAPLSQRPEDYGTDYVAWWPDGRPMEWSQRALARAVLQGVCVTGVEVVIGCFDGSRRTVLDFAAPIRLSTGEVGGAVGLSVDITDRRRAESELQRLYEEAQRAVRQREEVVGVVSHDLRNPLSTIAMASALLLDPALPEERKTRQAAVIGRAAEQMMRLIQDLLDFSRAGASRFAVEPRSEEPAALLRTAAQLGANAAEAKGVALTVAATAALPHVRADRQRILQVFSNLLENAIEFTPPGGHIVLGAHAAAGHVCFFVRDDGPGVPADEQGRVFDRFWQGRRHAQRGAGLGLAICKGIVEAHGGSISVQSDPGCGAVFRFTLPAA